MPKPKKYPEHERLKLVKDKSEICGAFLDWLQNERKPQTVLVEYDQSDNYVDCRKRIEELLAEYFEIDLKKIEKEKVEMIKLLSK
jgi:hypothetical protein